MFSLLLANSRAKNPLGKTLDRALDGDPATDENGLALIAALRAFDKRLALRWLAMPCNVNMLDDRGVTPLMVAAYRGYNDICQILLSLGADAQHSVERYYFEYDCGDRGHEEVERTTTHLISYEPQQYCESGARV